MSAVFDKTMAFGFVPTARSRCLNFTFSEMLSTKQIAQTRNPTPVICQCIRRQTISLQLSRDQTMRAILATGSKPRTESKLSLQLDLPSGAALEGT